MSLLFTRIKETCLYVKDLQRTREFYAGKLGLPEIGFAEGRHLFFRAGESVLLCFNAEATARDNSLPPHFGSGEQHFAFESSVDDYPAWKKKIEDAGITIEHEADWKNGIQSFYFRDPDNNLAEIVMSGLWD